MILLCLVQASLKDSRSTRISGKGSCLIGSIFFGAGMMSASFTAAGSGSDSDSGSPISSASAGSG